MLPPPTSPSLDLLLVLCCQYSRTSPVLHADGGFSDRLQRRFRGVGGDSLKFQLFPPNPDFMTV
eukprot:1094767-Prymnesium_polylepis.1